MKKMKQHFIMWGILTGGTIGFEESAIAICLWFQFGQPDFLVRPQHITLHIIMNTVAGMIFGLPFGYMVYNLSKNSNSTVRLFNVYISLVLLGFIIFGMLYWFILKFQTPLWFVGDIIIFVSGLLLTKLMTKKAQPMNAR